MMEVYGISVKHVSSFLMIQFIKKNTRVCVCVTKAKITNYKTKNIKLNIKLNI